MKLSEVITFMRETTIQNPYSDLTLMSCLVCVERLVSMRDLHRSIGSAGFSAIWVMCDMQHITCSGKEAAAFANDQRHHYGTYQITLAGDDFSIEKL